MKRIIDSFSSYLQCHIYIYLNTFIAGCSDGLPTGSLLVGSRQVGQKGSSSTASMRQPPDSLSSLGQQLEGYNFALEDLTNVQND